MESDFTLVLNLSFLLGDKESDHVFHAYLFNSFSLRLIAKVADSQCKTTFASLLDVSDFDDELSLFGEGVFGYQSVGFFLGSDESYIGSI